MINLLWNEQFKMYEADKIKILTDMTFLFQSSIRSNLQNLRNL
jgi:hypothetical protein